MNSFFFRFYFYLSSHALSRRAQSFYRLSFVVVVVVVVIAACFGFDPLSRRMSHKAECQLNLPAHLPHWKRRQPRRNEANKRTRRKNKRAGRSNEQTSKRANWRTTKANNNNNSSSCCDATTTMATRRKRCFYFTQLACCLARMPFGCAHSTRALARSLSLSFALPSTLSSLESNSLCAHWVHFVLLSAFALGLVLGRRQQDSWQGAH